MADATREPAGVDPSIDPSIAWPDPGHDTRPGGALRLVPAFDGDPRPHPGRAEALPSVRDRLAGRSERRQGSFAVYVLFLVTGAAVGVAIAAEFLAGQSGRCEGADAAGDCFVHSLAAPALTRFALVLLAAHATATLLLDVVPDVRRKLRAGYRPRRAPRLAPAVAPLAPGEPVSLLAAACWAPVQAVAPARRGATPVPPRDTVRALCPSCSAIVDARHGLCCGCGHAVVARRG